VYTTKVYVIQVMLTACYVVIRVDNSARVLNCAGYIRQEFLFLILAQESLLVRISFEMLLKT
jgi:hypothetical protein